MILENKTYQLETILSAIGEGIIMFDLHKKIIFQNSRALQMFGNHIGKRCFTIYSNDRKPCENCPAALCIKEDTIKSAIHTRIDDEGNLYYYEFSVAPVKEDGKIVATVEIIRDITQRKLLEEELQRTTRRLTTIINKMRNGLLYTNRRDEIAMGNDIGLDFFSVNQNDKLEAGIKDSDNENLKVLKKAMKAFKADSNVSFYEDNLQSEDKWYNVRFSASRSTTRRYYGTIASVTDITNLKKFDELKENLTHMIVHDMKNPLNTVMYVLEMAAEGSGMMEDVSLSHKKLFEIAHKDSKNLLNMVQQMLDVSKMEEGEHLLEKKDTYYKKTIKNSAKSVTFLAKARGVKIKKIYKTDIVALEIDEDYIERVVVNLLANAIKFSKEDSEIHILEKNLKNIVGQPILIRTEKKILK
jgi:PAS domain S-box-containing protein